MLSLPAEYEFKNLFIGLIISVVAVNLVINPILFRSIFKEIKANCRRGGTRRRIKQQRNKVQFNTYFSSNPVSEIYSTYDNHNYDDD